MYIMGRASMVPLGVTTARCVMLCMPRMALCRRQGGGRGEEGGGWWVVVVVVGRGGGWW